MIVPMKKATLLLSARSRKEALHQLRELGVLHVHHIQPPQGEEIDRLKSDLDQADKAVLILETVTGQSDRQADANEPVKTVIETVLETREQLQTLSNSLQEQKETARWYEDWGGISPASLETLRENGIYIRFYITDSASVKKLPEDAKIKIVNQSGSIVYLALFAESPEERFDFKEVQPPEIEKKALDKQIEEIRGRIAETENTLSSLAGRLTDIDVYRKDLEKKLEMSRVLHGMEDAEEFVLLQGFCPEDAVPALKETADTEGWGIILQEPDNPSEVPTLLKNSPAPRIIEPLFKFMGILPGYHEMDVSFIFLLFFSLFYAIIIGDAGYGLVFLGLTAFFRKKNPGAPVEPFALFYVLSVTTIIWGILTGTWFGSRAIAQWPLLKSLIIQPMFSFNESREATLFMMRFSFFLGLIQLSIAHFLSFLKDRKSLKGIAQLGWILIIIGMFYVVDLLVLNNPMPGYATILMIAGISIVGVFTNFQKNPLKMLGSFIGTILNSIQSVISAFSDIVSYIRLFAVGLAGVTVAASFNDMAGGFAAPLVLILGHGLNIVLGMMSVMVHGVRLNMLEFSGHLGQEWTGKPFNPFKK